MELKKKKTKVPRLSAEEVKTLRRHSIVPMKKKKKLEEIGEKEVKSQFPENAE